MYSKTTLVFGLGLALVSLTTASASWADCSDTPTTPEPTPPVTSASQVRFSEFLPAPADEEEFIEVEVLDDGGGNLNGWSIQDASGKRFTFDVSEMETETNRFLTVYQSTSKIFLNNGGDALDLIDPSGVIVEHQEYTTAPTDGSWSRLPHGWEWTTATPDAENVEPADQSGDDSGDPESDDPGDDSDSGDGQPAGGTGATPAQTLRLNEVLPNPSGNEATDEWIELENEGASGTLKGWQVTDGSSVYELPDEVVEANGFVLIGVADSGITLNNTGDTLYLIDPSSEIAQGVEFGAAPEDQSFARFGEEWSWVSTLTPGSVNVADELDPEAETSADSIDSGDSNDPADADTPETVDQLTIAEIKTLDKGTAVTVQGVVEVEDGSLGGQTTYIQDDTAGIQIYAYHKDFPSDMVRGSLVSVTGVMSSAYGEVRLNSDEGGISVMEQQDEVTPTAVDELVVDDVGRLVVVSGVVSSKTASRLTLENGAEVYVKSSTGISLSGVAVGNSVQVVGIVNQYNDTVRLQPREQEDLQVQAVGDAAGTSPVSAATLGQGSTTPAASTTSAGSTSWSLGGASQNTSPGWVVLGLAGVVLAVGVGWQWWKKRGVARRLFPSYTAQHESKGSTDSGRGVSGQLPAGPRP